MEIETIENIWKIHSKFAKDMEKQIADRQKGMPLKMEEIIHGKEKNLKRWKKRHKRLGEAKKEAINSLNEEIRRCQESISRLQKEIEEDRKTIEK